MTFSKMYKDYINPDQYQITHPEAHVIFKDNISGEFYIQPMTTINHGTLYHSSMCFPTKAEAVIAASQIEGMI